MAELEEAFNLIVEQRKITHCSLCGGDVKSARCVGCGFNLFGDLKHRLLNVRLETFCKQERIKKKKYDLGKTRLVFTNSMLSEICLRAQFHAGLKRAHNFAEHLPIKIGMNIHNGGLDRLFTQLSDFVFSVESDVTNMDSCLTEKAIRFGFRSWCHVYKIDPSDPLSVFNEECLAGAKTFKLGGFLVQSLTSGFNNSGHFLTGEINSIELLFFNFVLFFRNPPGFNTLYTIFSGSCINVYGDDNASGFNKPVSTDDVVGVARSLDLNVTTDKVIIRKKDNISDRAFLNGKSFLGQAGYWVKDHWVFIPARPEKLLANFLLPTNHELLAGEGEKNCVTSMLANFCYDDEVPIKLNGVERQFSIYDAIAADFCQKNSMIIPSRAMFKAARSGEERGSEQNELLGVNISGDGVVMTTAYSGKSEHKHDTLERYRGQTIPHVNNEKVEQSLGGGRNTVLHKNRGPPVLPVRLSFEQKQQFLGRSTSRVGQAFTCQASVQLNQRPSGSSPLGRTTDGVKLLSETKYPVFGNGLQDATTDSGSKTVQRVNHAKSKGEEIPAQETTKVRQGTSKSWRRRQKVKARAKTGSGTTNNGACVDDK
jgi:hypothetical protein